jgi:BNR repeat protein
MILSFLLLASVLQPEAVMAPYRQPQLAEGHGLVALTFASGKTIYFASSTDQGRTFSRPTKVAEVATLAAGRHRGPRAVILKDAIVISAVVSETISGAAPAHGSPAGGDLTVWRSVDQGKTWSKGGTINDVADAAREGLHAMTSDRNGNVLAAWLDLRAKGTRIFGSRSTDGGLTWSKNVSIYASPDGTVCQCCSPSIAADDSGQIWVMWRNALQGSRDLYISSSRDGAQFGPARKIGIGTWPLNACPMDGGGLAVEGDHVITAWRREGNIFLAEPGKAEAKIGAGKDVAIAHGKKGVYSAWSNGAGLEILTPGAGAAVPLASEGAYVSLLGLPDGAVLAAWETGNSIDTRRVD